MKIETKYSVYDEAYGIFPNGDGDEPEWKCSQGYVHEISIFVENAVTTIHYKLRHGIRWYFSGNTFPTRAEAEAECEKRNK